MDVDEHDVGSGLADAADRRDCVGGLSDDLDLVRQLGANAGEEQAVVVDQEHADRRRHAAPRFT